MKQIYEEAGELLPLYTILQERAIKDIECAATLLGASIDEWNALYQEVCAEMSR